MRIFLDVTLVYFHGSRGGISRLVRKIGEYLAHGDTELVCFVHAGDELYAVSEHGLTAWPRAAHAKAALRKISSRPFLRAALLRKFARRTWKVMSAVQLRLAALRGRTSRIESFEPGDIVLLVEATQDFGFFDLIAKRNRGGVILAIVADLFAINQPQFYRPGDSAGWAVAFKRYVELADGLICISRETAGTVRHYLARNNFSKPVSHFHLGSDFEAAPSSIGEPTQLPTLLSAQGPIVLSVSTIEPRKNYAYALALCSRLWSEGHQFSYVIAGAVGWMSEEFVAALRRHPQFGRRLFHNESPGDRELLALYRASRIFLSTSFDEGFGLPVMEAHRHGLRVICSDIPIFRELCGESADYISLDNVEAAAARLAAVLGQADAPRATAKPPGLLSWRESVAQLMAEISYFHEHRQFRN